MPKRGKPVVPEEQLLRRSYCDPLRKYLNPDGTAHSRVFKPRPSDQGRLSVDVRSLTTLEKAIKDPEKFILFELRTGDVTASGLEVVHDPLDDGSNDAHALIQEIAEDDDLSPALLARMSRRVA